MRDEMTAPVEERADAPVEHDYEWKVRKEGEFWGTMARLRWRGGIPKTMDFSRATRYRVRRSELGWGDYFQDPALDRLLPFGRAWNRFVRDARNVPGTRVLDLCCGAGWLALEHARAGKRVDAVDLSREEITIAREYQATLDEQLAPISWIVADLNTIDLVPGEYDLVTAWDGLHHIQQIDRLCEQASRALKPGGRFMMSERVWGGARPSVRARIGMYLEQLLWTIVPTPAPATYGVKFRQLFDAYARVFRSKVLGRKGETVAWQEQGEICSPFEDAVGVEMMESITRYFEVERIEQYGAFTEEVQRSLYLPRVLRMPLLVLLSWVDHATIKLGLLEGKIVMVYARRKETAGAPATSQANGRT
jgi:SAM-dependent methyltransferase